VSLNSFAKFQPNFYDSLEGQWWGAWFLRAICCMFRGQGFGSNFHEDGEFMDDCIQGLNPVRANIVATNRSFLYKSRYSTCTQALNALAWTHVQSVRCTLVGHDVLIRRKVFIFTLFFFLVLIIDKVQRFVRNCRKKAVCTKWEVFIIRNVVKDVYYAKTKDNLKNLFWGRHVLFLMSWDHDVFGKTTGESKCESRRINLELRHPFFVRNNKGGYVEVKTLLVY
jgi:hypothetical protein